MLDRIQFRTTKDGVISLTDQIKECVKNSGVKSGIMCAFITHTKMCIRDRIVSPFRAKTGVKLLDYSNDEDMKENLKPTRLWVKTIRADSSLICKLLLRMQSRKLLSCKPRLID